MTDNPLKQYFRQPSVYVKLPTKGAWYTNNDVIMSADGEVAIYPMGAIDEILLNTPDAMLNGQSLEKVIKNCVPDIKNVKRLLIPDLEAIFVGMKSANNEGKADIDRKCPNCNHENSFELDCSTLLDQIVYIDENDAIIKFDNDLVIYCKPYDMEMRQLWIRKEFEEEKIIKSLDLDKESDEFRKAGHLSESVDRLAQITFDLVSRSIVKIIMVKENIEITDQKFISEWLREISQKQSEIVIDTVNNLNKAGVLKEISMTCTACNHQWVDQLNFDPTSFFGKR